MQVVIGSAHRNNVDAHLRYFRQIDELVTLLDAGGHKLRVIAVEGDSIDRTRHSLVQHARRYGLDLDLRTCNHGGPEYGSTESTDRLQALSRVGNEILDGVSLSDDVLVYVESDLIWDPGVIHRLINRVANGDREYIQIWAPLVFAGEHFYDVFLFRGLDGQRFAPFAPYHSQLREGVPVEVESAGSCLVMPAYVALDRSVRMTHHALLDFCSRARSAGYRIAVDPDLRIFHP